MRRQVGVGGPVVQRLGDRGAVSGAALHAKHRWAAERLREHGAAAVGAAGVDDDVEDAGTATNSVQSLQAKFEIREPRDVPTGTHDSRSRIDQGDVERIFGAFLTTKSNGVGMNRLACRAVIEARDGGLLPLSGVESGSVFRVALPVGNFGSAQ